MRESANIIVFCVWNFLTFMLATHVVEALWHGNVILAIFGLFFFPGGICRGFMLWHDWIAAIL